MTFMLTYVQLYYAWKYLKDITKHFIHTLLKTNEIERKRNILQLFLRNLKTIKRCKSICSGFLSERGIKDGDRAEVPPIVCITRVVEWINGHKNGIHREREERHHSKSIIEGHLLPVAVQEDADAGGQSGGAYYCGLGVGAGYDRAVLQRQCPQPVCCGGWVHLTTAHVLSGHT